MWQGIRQLVRKTARTYSAYTFFYGSFITHSASRKFFEIIGLSVSCTSNVNTVIYQYFSSRLFNSPYVHVAKLCI